MVYRPLWLKNGPYAYVGFEMKNLFNFTFLLVDFGKVLCSSATSSSKTQMLLEKNIFRRYCLFFIDSSVIQGPVARSMVSVNQRLIP